MRDRTIRCRGSRAEATEQTLRSIHQREFWLGAGLGLAGIACPGRFGVTLEAMYEYDATRGGSDQRRMLRKQPATSGAQGELTPLRVMNHQARGRCSPYRGLRLAQGLRRPF